MLKLAPAYDMLPMALAPAANGMLSEGLPEPPLPASAVLPVWQQAAELANEFWQRVAENDRISVDFRSLGRRHRKFAATAEPRWRLRGYWPSCAIAVGLDRAERKLDLTSTLKFSIIISIYMDVVI